jgi:hypothetical protein
LPFPPLLGNATAAKRVNVLVTSMIITFVAVFLSSFTCFVSSEFLLSALLRRIQ